MLKLLDPALSRTEQLSHLTDHIRHAKNSKIRASYLDWAADNFALILKRKHAKVTFGRRILYRPLEHIEVIMAAPRNWQKEFAVVTLSEKDKEPLKLYQEEHENNPFEPLENLLGLGYKVSILWSDSSQCFIVSVIGTDDTKVNSNKVLSSFTDSLEESFFMAGYKVFVLADGGEWPSQKEQTRWG